KHYDDALVKAQAAFKKVPWLYEAELLEGDIRMRQAFYASDFGKFEESTAFGLSAIQAYQRAAEIGRSDPKAYLGLCNAWTNVLFVRTRTTGQDVEAPMKSASDSCEQALQADSLRPDIYVQIANTYRIWSDFQLEHSQDPARTLQKSIDAS